MTEDNYNSHTNSNLTPSERRLKRISDELSNNIRINHTIEDKISQVKQKMIRQNANEHIQTSIRQSENSNQPSQKQRFHTEVTAPNNKISSFLPSKVSKASLLNLTHQNKDNSKGNIYRRTQLQDLRQQRVIRDKLKNPNKYKIIHEQIGMSDRQTFNLSQDQVLRVQEQFMKRKGLEYLREGIMAGNQSRDKDRSISINRGKGRLSSLNFTVNRRIPQIMPNNLIQKRNKSEKVLRHRMKTKAKLQQLKEQQQMLGKIVFQKVKRHLKEDKQNPNYFRRVYSEQTIDDALVDFLQAKIKRAQVHLNKK